MELFLEHCSNYIDKSAPDKGGSKYLTQDSDIVKQDYNVKYQDIF